MEIPFKVHHKTQQKKKKKEKKKNREPVLSSQGFQPFEDCRQFMSIFNRL